MSSDQAVDPKTSGQFTKCAAIHPNAEPERPSGKRHIGMFSSRRLWPYFCLLIAMLAAGGVPAQSPGATKST